MKFEPGKIYSTRFYLPAVEHSITPMDRDDKQAAWIADQLETNTRSGQVLANIANQIEQQGTEFTTTLEIDGKKFTFRRKVICVESWECLGVSGE